MKHFMKISAIMLGLATTLVVSGVQQELLLALKFGRVDAVKNLLARENDINGKIADGAHSFCALKLAVQAISNNAELVRLVVDKGADVNTKDADGTHILIWAILQKNMDVIKFLIDKGADVNAKNKDGIPASIYMAMTNNVEGAKLLMSKNVSIPLEDAGYAAVLFGHVEFVDFLLSCGLNVNHADDKGNSLLHNAAYSKKGTEVVKFLLSKGAAINAKNKDGRTPLHRAAMEDNALSVKILISKGADVNAKDKDGLTPLELAKKEKAAQTVMMMGGEVDENYKDENGNTLLHIAAKLNMPEQAAKLLERGVSANAKNKNGMTPLHIAATSNNVKIAELLLAKGARQLKTEDGYNPLHCAAAFNCVAVAELLLKKGAKTEVKDKKELTPLHLAVICDRAAVAELLLKKGAKTEVMDKDKRTPLYYAVTENYIDVARLLVDHGADVNVEMIVPKKDFYANAPKASPNSAAYYINLTLIDYAILKKHFDIAKLMINAKQADIKMKFKKWYNSLYSIGEFNGYLAEAVEANSIDIVSALLPKLDVASFVADAGKALCTAARNGNVDMCKLLLGTLNGIDGLDKKDTASGKKTDIDKFTILVSGRHGSQLYTYPLHEAVTGGNIDCVKLLLDQGADINRQRRNDGDTPLHCAVRNKDAKTAVALVKLLMDKGAKAGITNGDRKKAIDLTKNDEIIEMLDGAE